MPSLPPELHAIIVDHLYDDWRALLSCVRTQSELLSSPAAYHLSHTIHIDHYNSPRSSSELVDFLQMFKSHPDLVPLLRSLHIHGSSSHTPSGTFPAYIDLSQFHNLRALSLSDLLVDLPGRLCRVICSMPALEELSLQGLRRPPSLPGRYHAIPDILPTPASVGALRSRLKALHVGASVPVKSEKLYSDIAILLVSTVDGEITGDMLALEELGLHFRDQGHSEAWLSLLCHGARGRTIIRLGVTLVNHLHEPNPSRGEHILPLDMLPLVRI